MSRLPSLLLSSLSVCECGSVQSPELDSTLINKLTDDKRSVVFDGAVRSVPWVGSMRLVIKQNKYIIETKHKTNEQSPITGTFAVGLHV